MYLADACNTMGDGYAAKLPDWAGYIKKTVKPEGGYKLEIIERAHLEGGTIPTYDVDKSGVMTATNPAELEHELMTAMLSTDWIIAPASNFEAARSATGNKY